jgi:hypothetical protein
MGYVITTCDPTYYKEKFNQNVIVLIKKANLFIADMTAPEHNHNNTWYELGIAVGCQKEIWIISDNLSEFFKKTGFVHFKSWNDVFSELDQSTGDCS